MQEFPWLYLQTLHPSLHKVLNSLQAMIGHLTSIRTGVNIRSSLVNVVTTIRARFVTVKLYLGLRMFASKPSAVRILRCHCHWLAELSSQHRQGTTCRMDLTPHILGNDGSRDSSEASKEPFTCGPHQVGGRAGGQPRFTSMDVEAEEVLYDSQIKQLRIRAQLFGAHLFLSRSRQPALCMIIFNMRHRPQYTPVFRVPSWFCCCAFSDLSLSLALREPPSCTRQPLLGPAIP